MFRSERIRRWFLLDLDQRIADWAAATEAPRAARMETVLVLQDLLEKQLDRANDGLAAIDTKAALVIPGVGVVASVLVGHIASSARSTQPVLALLLALVAMASTAVVLSLLCLGPWWRRPNGPEPLPVVLSTDADELAVRLGYINQLGIAVSIAQGVLNVKAGLLNWAIRGGGAGVVCLLVFAAAGGLQ